MLFERCNKADKQRNIFLKGKGSGSFIAPHHRHQLSVIDNNGVIDELNHPGHPNGNNHTKLVNGVNRHPGKSYFKSTPKGESLRKKEITLHFKNKGRRLVKDDHSDLWFDPEY